MSPGDFTRAAVRPTASGAHQRPHNVSASAAPTCATCPSDAPLRLARSVFDPDANGTPQQALPS